MRFGGDQPYGAGEAELLDRRQRAREAAYDGSVGHWSTSQAIEQAIETAVRVRVTDEIVEAARDIWPSMTIEGARVALAAAFRVAGFEVEE